MVEPDWNVRTRPGDPAFVDPEIMTTENCFQHFRNPTSYVYVKLLSNMGLAVAHGDGQCPAGMPTNSVIYYR